jgi:hypothetical protein
MRQTTVISILALLTGCSRPAQYPRNVVVNELPCTRGELPAYAHNDYENDTPLFDALSLGYRGVEADVFLVNGVLRVGHSRPLAERGGSLEALYLVPLRSLVSRCGGLSSDARRFLLTIELKEASLQAYQALVSLLQRYEFGISSAYGKAVQIVLVGWHPQKSQVPTGGLFGLQFRIERPDEQIPPGLSRGIGLLSVDFGQNVASDWRYAASRAAWLQCLRLTKAAFPDRLIRVHNVPVDSTIYASLLAAGVDLLGVRELRSARRLLLKLGSGRE